MVKAIIRRAGRRAGIAGYDNVTIKRGYVAFLESQGLDDPALRDALGIQMMSTLDHIRGSHRRRRAQRRVYEHHMLPLPAAFVRNTSEPAQLVLWQNEYQL